MRGRGETDVVVLGLPRGGVPVAAEVADALGAPLDVLVVRKLGLPFEPEVAMGAIGEEGVRTLDRVLMARAGVTAVQLDEIESQERATLEERSRRLRALRRRVDLTGRTAIIVDDGIATGSTAMAACRVARLLGASRVVVAAPVGSPTAISRLTDADDVVCVLEPADFTAVGRHYLDFTATSDAEVEAVLARAESG